MIERLQNVNLKIKEIEEKISKPEIIADTVQYRLLMKEYKALLPISSAYIELKKIQDESFLLEEMLADKSDPELTAMIADEIDALKDKEKALTDEIKFLLLPKDPNDDKNVIIEIRAGAGGEEAALFSAVLYRMYTMYAQNQSWKTEIIETNETELGGFKVISFSVQGDGAYSKLKYESGVHRVQRVPETESQGRIQTSTVTVAVLPEAEEVEIEINPIDLVIDAHRASGAGGQHVNKTDSAIRILHKPSGIVVECQDERSQLKNKEKAMRVLRSKLYQAELEKQNSKIADERKSQIGTGDRSERIRTYNYPQGRISDHRISLTTHAIEAVLNGKLDEIIEPLARADRMKQIEKSLDK